MAAWLLNGPRWSECVEWVIDQRFTGISVHSSSMKIDRRERERAAAAIKEAGLHVTYHANVPREPSGAPDFDQGFAARMLEDVLWWHEHAGGVSCCGLDVIKYGGQSKDAVGTLEINLALATTVAERLRPHGIPIGFENNCAPTAFTRLDSLRQLKRDHERTLQGMLLDAGHANVHVRRNHGPGEKELGEYVREIPFEIFDVHLSDNHGTADEHNPLGQGSVDLASLCGALRAKQFKGQLTVEVCVDIASRRYAADIRRPEETDPLLISRDKIREAWCASDPGAA
jgi:sugar phosphate isomerase/epimerase